MKKHINLVLPIFLIGALLVLLFSILENNQSKAEGKFRIGILQLVEHDALDDARLGFIDGLAEHGLIEGKNITLEYENA